MISAARDVESAARVSSRYGHPEQRADAQRDDQLHAQLDVVEVNPAGERDGEQEAGADHRAEARA
ncbi:MAG TPA: hypothetical protein VGJ63_02225, partial [Micromonosporaceae bacterium]